MASGTEINHAPVKNDAIQMTAVNKALVEKTNVQVKYNY